MKKFKSVFVFLMVITVCFFLRSCFSEPYSYEDFLIKVDSIHIPDTISLNIPFDIEFFGIIGFDGCHSFKTFNKSVKNNDIMIEAWGSYENKNGICPAVMVYLEGQKLNMTFHTPGNYNINIIQPGNTSLVRQITVN
ncbi:MAG: hypothetical protein EPN88_07580 [Bacteroidetes bacterium]|nr:MAG: hypothetical protein EPN88_07580 [Bacteroidota bacterium]